MEKIRVEEIKPIRLWGQVSFEWLLAFHFSSSELTDTQFALDMKKNLILSMIISFAMICSCQKQDSAPEQQLAQRKTELDPRETALIERLNALDEKVNALDKQSEYSIGSVAVADSIA